MRYVKYSPLSVAKRNQFSKNPCTNRMQKCQHCAAIFWTSYGPKHYKTHHPGIDCPSICRINEEVFKEMLNLKYVTSSVYVEKGTGKKKLKGSKNKSKTSQRKSAVKRRSSGGDPIRKKRKIIDETD